MAATTEPDLTGRTLLGRLRVLRRLGEGGTGVVYEVEHLLTRHRRALKVIRPELGRSAEAVARLVREAGIAGRLQSPHLVETYDVGRLEDGSTYVLMELLDGVSLGRRLKEDGALDARSAARMGLGVCVGLQAVHAAHIVHRDIKPENLFLCDGRVDAVKLLDFGTCKLLKDADLLGTLTRTGGTPGSPAYMAPEQLDPEAVVDARTDVYALGVVLYEAVSGRRPFEGKTPAAVALEIRAASPPPLSEVDDALATVITRAMSADPELRYPTARAFGEALQACSGGGSAEWLAEGARVLGGRYEIRRTLGSGGMGVVYEALDREKDRPVAVKAMLPSRALVPELRERFAREATVTRGLDSPHLVKVLDAAIDEDTDTPFIVTELLEGEDLGRHITRHRALPRDEALPLLRQIASALSTTHAAGIVHRDLKPANLFLATSAEGGSTQVKVLDFGVAKVLEAGDDGHSTGGLLGTPAYMAPEQATGRGELTAAVDLYAFGQIAFTALVGKAYYDHERRGTLLQLLTQVAEGAPEPATARARRYDVTIPEALDAWFARATAVDPEQRFQDASTMVEALEGALSAGARSARASSEGVEARRDWRSAKVGLALLVVVAIVAALGLGAQRSTATGPPETKDEPLAPAAGPPPDPAEPLTERGAAARAAASPKPASSSEARAPVRSSAAGRQRHAPPPRRASARTHPASPSANPAPSVKPPRDSIF